MTMTRRLRLRLSDLATLVLVSVVLSLTLTLSLSLSLSNGFLYRYLPNRVSRSSTGSVLRMSSSSTSSFGTQASQIPQIQPRVDLTPDGAVYKVIDAPGTGKIVQPGDILAVEYTGRVKESNALPFAKGEQEKFVFKDGSMIRGWDIGVGSMKVGERARIVVDAKYAYGKNGVNPVIPPNADLEFDVKILAYLGNQMNPESLFEKDLDIDPFVASTPEAIKAEFDAKQARIADKYEGNIVQIYLRRIKNISLGFGGSNFFASQSGERPPWYLNPNITFPSMIVVTLAAFITVLASGGVKEKGEVPIVDNPGPAITRSME